jgi:hypothetical protein
LNLRPPGYEPPDWAYACRTVPAKCSLCARFGPSHCVEAETHDAAAEPHYLQERLQPRVHRVT